MKQRKKLVVIDAMSLAYKAYFAFIARPLKTKSGEPTSAVYGFVTQILKIFEDIKPDMVMVASDSKEKTFRHEKYSKYKANRAVMPDDMIQQIGRIKEVVDAFNLPLLVLPGYEADDIAGTIALKAEELGYDSYLVTPDKDYVQLLTEHTKIVIPGKSGDALELIDIAAAKSKYGFEPKQIIDYLALLGDASDNIPGVKGIGEKSALPLIQTYGTIESVYDNLDKIEKKAQKENLIAGHADAIMSKDLITILTTVPIELDFEHAQFTSPDFAKIEKLFTELEFSSLLKKTKSIFSVTDSSFPAENFFENSEDDLTEIKKFNASKVNYKLINTVDEAVKLFDILSRQELIVFDTETDSLDTFNINIAGVSFCYQENEAFFVAINPFFEATSLFAPNLSDRIELPDFKKIFQPLFENENIKKVCQNGKYDIGVLKSIGIETANFYFDTMIASYLIDPDEKHGMDALAEQYLNYKPIPLSSLIGVKKDPTKIFEVDLNELSNYSAEDADITFKLYNILSKEIENNNLTRLAYDIEFPLAIVLGDVERAGIKIDKPALRAFSADLDVLIQEYTRNIHNLAGGKFNVNSPSQLQKILFDQLGLKSGKKIKTGFSTDAQTLEYLRGEHPIIDIILEYRQVAKLKSTYADSLPNLIEPKTGRLHTSFNQTVASTGRLSSVEPNLQNIPIRTALGKEIRKAFIPADKDHLLLSLDYSQIELRIMASISGDEALCKAFQNGEDIHRSTAALVFLVPPSEVTQDMRRKAKEVNFGILYGIGAFGLKTRLGIPQSQAKEIIDTYFNTFKSVKQYMDTSILAARAKGYAETLTGRRRFLRNINDKNTNVRQFEERAAINMPIQGTAADMIKIARVNIHNEMKRLKCKTKMVLQVHDELLFDIPKDELDVLKPMLKNMMESAFPLNVPVLVEAGVGENWLDAH